MPSKWIDVEFWRKRFAHDKSTEPPARENDIGPHTVFGWMEVKAPDVGACCGIEASYWVWCPTAQELAGYVRHCYVPGCLRLLFDMEILKRPLRGYMVLEELLQKAPPAAIAEAGIDAKALVSVAESLDRAAKQKSTPKSFAQARRAIERFGEIMRTDDGPVQDLTVFQDSEAVGAFVIEELRVTFSSCEEALGMSKEEWLSYCVGATKDKKAGKAFRKVLEGLNQV